MTINRKKQLKDFCLVTDRSMSSIIDSALEMYFSSFKKKSLEPIKQKKKSPLPKSPNKGDMLFE